MSKIAILDNTGDWVIQRPISLNFGTKHVEDKTFI